LTRLDPPDDRGYLVANVALDDAMRLLGGRNRRLLLLGLGGVLSGGALVLAGLIGGVASLLLGST
jgi:hypothetical protein